MARLKPPKPPTPQQSARYGIDTLFFTLPAVISTRPEILALIQQLIDPALLDKDLVGTKGNAFYRQGLKVVLLTEDPDEFHDNESKPWDYKGKSVTLLQVYYDPRPPAPGKLFDNETTAFQIKGELLSRIDYNPLLMSLMCRNASITRIDFFKDDFLYDLKMSEMFTLCESSYFLQHIQSSLVNTYRDVFAGEHNIYLGKKSGRQISIYNKALEVGEKFHHIRCELRLRKDNKFQTELVKALVEGADEEQLISNLIGKYLQFKPKGEGSIYDRQPFDWWKKFLGTTSPIRRVDYVPVKPPARSATADEVLSKIAKLKKEVANLEKSMSL